MKRREVTRMGLIAGIASFFGFPEKSDVIKSTLIQNNYSIDSIVDEENKRVIDSRLLGTFAGEDGTRVHIQLASDDLDNWKRENGRLVLDKHNTLIHNTIIHLMDNGGAKNALMMQRCLVNSEFEIDTIVLKRKGTKTPKVYRS